LVLGEVLEHDPNELSHVLAVVERYFFCGLFELTRRLQRTVFYDVERYLLGLRGNLH
jgi:hypothetical protein